MEIENVATAVVVAKADFQANVADQAPTADHHQVADAGKVVFVITQAEAGKTGVAEVVEMNADAALKQ